MTRTGKFAIGCASAVFGACGIVAVFSVIFLFTSCSFNKPLVASGLPDPDKAFQTGTVAGANVYIWECFQNKRIVVYNETAEMTSGAYKREEVACGEQTPFEKLIASQRTRALDPKTFWH